MSDDAAPGWEAIDAACERAHPGIEPMHWGTVMRWSLGGNDPLDGTSAYPVDGPTPHWHYVGYGLTELFEKVSENAAESGWGFELTFRLARRPGEPAPIWPLSLMQNLARYVFNSGNWFEPGHHIDANGPIALDEPTRLTALLMAEDPELGTIDTPNGRVQFVQMVGVTADELAAVQQWNADDFLAELRRRSALLVTDLTRPSLLDDPAFAATLDAGIAAEGSSLSSLFVTSLAVQEVNGELAVHVRANAVGTLLTALPNRLPHGRTFALTADDGTEVAFEPGDAAGAHRDGTTTTLTLTPAALGELLATLQPTPGTYRVPALPGVAFTIA